MSYVAGYIASAAIFIPGALLIHRFIGPLPSFRVMLAIMVVIELARVAQDIAKLIAT